ncbi:MAG TPA: hypothetical protein PLG41_13765 [Leptospiraceae bacterium]|nr:hypothetical protein [Leptospiraceae bacterium]
MKSKIILISLIYLWITVNSLFSDNVKGKVIKVISGDTFITETGGGLCRFYYYRAPSMKTKRGKLAKKELEKLILNKEIHARVPADDENGYASVSNILVYPVDFYKPETVDTILIRKKLLYQYRKRKYID